MRKMRFRTCITSLAYSTFPGILGLLMGGCEELERAQAGDLEFSESALVETRSGTGPGSYDTDSKADLGVFSPAANPTMNLRKSTGTGFNAAVSQGAGFCSNSANLLDGDFNNDQLDDIACVDGTAIKVRTRKSDLTGFNTVATWLTWSAIPADSIVLVGDFVGNDSARKDDLAFYNPANHSIWVAKSTGTAFNTPTQWITGFCGGGQLYVGDFDGDAKEDMACFTPSNGTIKVAKSTGTAFQAPTTWISSFCTTGASLHIAEFTGPGEGGRDDFACVQADGTVSSVAISNGTAFTAAGSWLGTPGFGSNPGLYIGADYTGDGKSDLGFCDAATNSFKVAVSNGSSFGQPVVWIAAGGINCSGRIFGAPTRDNNSTVGQQPLAEWTYMVYMAADNNLESAAWLDLTEMQMAAASTKVNIIVMLDTSSTTDEFLGNCVYLKVTAGSHGVALKNLGECNTGNWSTLSAFTAWATSRFPAKRFGLDMWDHGGGWTKSVTDQPLRDCCVDDHQGTGGGPGAISVANGHWRSALQALNTQLGRKIDLVGFDACIMGMWEVAAASKDYANYLVASEDYVPFYGWVYNGFLVPLVATPTMSASTLGGLIVQSYDSSTMSLIDLSKIPALTTAVSSLGSALLANPGQFSAVNTARSSSNVYKFNSTMVDLGMFGSQLSATTTLPAAIRNAGATVRSSLAAAVLQQHTQSPYLNATGLSIYLPALNDHTDPTYYNGVGAVWNTTQWDEFLRAFAP